MTESAKGTFAAPGQNVRAKDGLNRALLARGHADFSRMLTYKCERSGAKLDRKSDVSGKSVFVRVELGGRRVTNLNTTHTQKIYSQQQPAITEKQHNPT